MPDIDWDEFDEDIWAVLAALVVEIIMAGIAGGVSLLPAKATPFIDFDSLYAHVLEYVRTYRFEWIRGLTDFTRRQVVDIISNWIRSGSPLSALEQALIPIFGEARARRIAVTEVTRLFARGNQMAWEATGFVNAVKWMTAEDEKVCPICNELDGTLIGIGDIDALPPAHVNCVLPGTIVSAPDLVAAAKSFYVGGCIEIITSSGRRLSVTKNHPILTSRGWIAAQFINETDNVIITTNGKRIASSINPDYQYRPAKIEQLFSSLMMSSGVISRSVKPSPVDFHGDGRGINSNINVVHIHGFLSRNIKPSVSKSFGEFNFNRTNMQLPEFNGFRPSDALGNSAFSTLSSSMSSRNLPLALLGGHASPLQSLGLALISRSNTGDQKITPKGSPINSSLAGEFILRFPGDISFDKIVKIRNFDYSGHVYDLQTGIYELYTCNDIITHNCRCWIQPVVDDAAFSRRLDEILGL